MVPYVLGWLGKYGDAGVIYRVIRDMPWLLERIHEEGENCGDDIVDMSNAGVGMIATGSCSGRGSCGSTWEKTTNVSSTPITAVRILATT